MKTRQGDSYFTTTVYKQIPIFFITVLSIENRTFVLKVTNIIYSLTFQGQLFGNSFTCRSTLLVYSWKNTSVTYCSRQLLLSIIMLPDRPSTLHIVPLPWNCPLVRVKIRLQSLSSFQCRICISTAPRRWWILHSAYVAICRSNTSSSSRILPELSKLSTKPVGQYMAGSVCLK